MQKMKKIVSFLTAAAMAFSLSSVALSAEYTGEDGTATGQGDTDWFVLEDKALVTLPTALNLDFTFDPQGLANLTPTGMDLDTFLAQKGKNTAGIVFAAGSELRIINNSNFAVDVGVNLAITGDAKVIDDVGDQAELTTLLGDTENNIIMYAIPSSTNLKYNAATALDTPGTVTQAYTSSGKGYPVDAGPDVGTGTDLAFKLDAADYTIFMPEDGEDASDIEITPQSGTGNGQALKLKGYINPNADWSAYIDEADPKEVVLTATWTVDKATVPEIAAENVVAGIPNLVKHASITPADVEAAEATSSPAVSASGWDDDADLEKDSGITYDAATVHDADLDLGFNIAAGIATSSVEVVLAADLIDATAVPTASLTIADNKLYIDKDYNFPVAGPLELTITIGEKTWTSDVTVTEIPIANGWDGTENLARGSAVNYEAAAVGLADLDLGFNTADGVTASNVTVTLGGDLLEETEIEVAANKLYIDSSYALPTSGPLVLTIAIGDTTWTSDVTVTPIPIANGWDGTTNLARGSAINYDAATVGVADLDLGFNTAEGVTAANVTVTLGGSALTASDIEIAANKLYIDSSYALPTSGPLVLTIAIGDVTWTSDVTVTPLPITTGWIDPSDTATTYSLATLGSANLDLGFNVATGVTVDQIEVKFSTDITTASPIGASNIVIVDNKLYIKNAYALARNTATRNLSIKIGEQTWTGTITTNP